MSDDQPLLLFDVDGVLLKEDGYYRTLALTCAQFYRRRCGELGIAVHESLAGRVSTLAEVDELKRVFLPTPVLSLLRARAINSNWDKTYAIVLGLLALTQEDLTSTTIPAALIRHLGAVAGQGQAYLQALRQIGESHAKLFQDVYEVFQQIHLGPWSGVDFLAQGMLAHDEATVDAAALRSLLASLRERGCCLGIGTGRPRLEVEVPFRGMGFWSFFDEKRVVTVDEVRARERERGLAPFALAKPHPFTYQTGADGVPLEQVYVIGDSMSDALAAEAAGYHFIGVGGDADFAATLRPSFAVVSDVLALWELLG